MKFENIICKESCLLLQQNVKTEVLIELMELIHTNNLYDDLEGLKKDIFYREQLMSTGLGQGIAIPHVRIPGLDVPIIALGVQPKGIKDYGSLDNEPVKIVVMILVGAEQQKVYLRILSQLMMKLKSSEFKDALLKAEDGDALYALIQEDPWKS